MQNKGAIKIFAIALALICLFQLSFTLVTKHVESKALKYASSKQTEDESFKAAKDQLADELFQKKFDSLSTEQQQQLLNNPNFEMIKKSKYQDLVDLKTNLYLDSVSREVAYNIGIRKYTFRECKERELNLGLDLKGGMNVTMEISVADIVKGMSGNSKDPLFNKAIANAVVMQKSSTKDFVTLFGEAFKELDPQAKLSSPTLFGKAELKDRINFNTTNDEVLKIISKEADASVDRAFNILRTRIDRFGVSQPNIQKLSNSGRILIELPGVKEPERVRKLLQGTAKLEFWETYEYAKVYKYLEDANTRLKQSLKEDLKDSLGLKDTLATANNKKTDAKNDTLKKDTASSTLDQIAGDTSARNKKDSFDKFSKDNPLFAYLNPSLIQDEKGNYFPAKGPVSGYALIKDTARINKLMNLKYIKALFPNDLKFLWTVKPIDKKETTLQLIAIRITNRDQKAPLTGEVIADARQDYSQAGKPEIMMMMNSEGARTWKRLTAENIDKSIAIVLDDFVYSFPTVQSEIPNGRSSISGNFTIQEAQDLANILKAGSLPAPAHIVEEAIVGPTLGKEAIANGLWSFVVAFLLTLLFMIFYYNRAGMVADIALFTNMFFVFGILASLGAVLTLPGIAGIVLTIGMDVDKNVIIYERIREEIRSGKGIRLAIDDGYKHAYSAIIDSNVITLLTGIVLYVFGSGPVQGFATTLIIGIASSLFCAIFITRLLFLWMMDKNMEITVWRKSTKNFLTNVHIDFIGLRKTFYILSLALVVVGIVSLATRGLSRGIDFLGGRTYVVRFDQDVTTEKVRASLGKVFDGNEPEVKTFGHNNQVKITTSYRINDKSATTDSIVETKLFSGLVPFYKTKITQAEFVSHDEKKELGRLSSQKVEPTIAYSLLRKAFMAVFFSLMIIFIYIAIRFKKWQWGLGGVVSLFHDTFIIISIFSLFNGILPFSLEIGQDFIAAILTIIGYSIMDSVIIFDRIREYQVLYPKRDMHQNMNDAMNSTLSRTLNTSGITFMVLLAMFLFGGEVIRGFTFALLVGVAIGTYSSVFNATPVAYDAIRWIERRKAKKLQNIKR